MWNYGTVHSLARFDELYLHEKEGTSIETDDEFLPSVCKFLQTILFINPQSLERKEN